MVLGLDSSELGHPARKILSVFRTPVKTLSFKSNRSTAGEEGRRFVLAAINQIGVDRIRSRNRALETLSSSKKLKKRET